MKLRRAYFLINHAFPLVTSSVGLMLIGLIDTMTVSHLGNSVLVAQSLAAFINMTIFMGLAAFIFPVANLCQLDTAKQKQYLTVSLYLLLFIGLVITCINWLIAPFLAHQLLPSDARVAFIHYFQSTAFRILPAILFFYSRMLIYTTDEPMQLIQYVLVAFLLNSFGNLLIYYYVHDIPLVMQLIGLWGAIIFSLLVFAVNSKLPSGKKFIELLFNHSWHYQSIKKVLTIGLPSLLTSYFEYVFFCVIGIILLKNIPEHLSTYRVILQLEELFILMFYGLSTVISIEISKQVNGHDSSLGLDTKIYLIIVLSSATILYFLLPNLFRLFDLDFPKHHFIYIINVLLLISECVMLLSLAFLRGLGLNQIILTIMFTVNWIIITPFLVFFPPDNVDQYFYALIINYLIISSTAFFIFNWIQNRD